MLVIAGPDEDVAKEPQKVDDSFYLQTLLLTPEHFGGISVVARREDAARQARPAPVQHDLPRERPATDREPGEEPGAVHRRRRRRRRVPRAEGRPGRLQQAHVPRRRRASSPRRSPSNASKPLTEDEKLRADLRPHQADPAPGPAVQDPPRPGRALHQRARRHREGAATSNASSSSRASSNTGRSRASASGARTSRSRRLFCLPNDSPLSLMEPRVDSLIKAVHARYGEPKFEKYRAAVDEQFTKIRSLFVTEGTPMTDTRARDRPAALRPDQRGRPERGALPRVLGPARDGRAAGAWPRRCAIRASSATRSILRGHSATAAWR